MLFFAERKKTHKINPIKIRSNYSYYRLLSKRPYKSDQTEVNHSIVKRLTVKRLTLTFTFSKTQGSVNIYQLIHDIKAQKIHYSLLDSLLKIIIKNPFTNVFSPGKMDFFPVVSWFVFVLAEKIKNKTSQDAFFSHENALYRNGGAIIINSFIWIKVFQNDPSKTFKKWSDMVCLGRWYYFKIFKAVFHKFYLDHSWIPWPI